MIRHAYIFLCAVLAISCGGSFENAEVSSLCVAPLRGKVIGPRPLCAGIVIQVTGGEFQPSQVQASFTDSDGNTFANTFRLIGVSEMPAEDALRLNDPDNVGEEFLFYFSDTESTVEDGCGYCKPYVLFPDVKNRITLTNGECNDTLE